MSTCQALEERNHEGRCERRRFALERLGQESERKEHVMDDVLITRPGVSWVMRFNPDPLVIVAVCGACGDVCIQKGSANCFRVFSSVCCQDGTRDREWKAERVVFGCVVWKII